MRSPAPLLALIPLLFGCAADEETSVDDGDGPGQASDGGDAEGGSGLFTSGGGGDDGGGEGPGSATTSSDPTATSDDGDDDGGGGFVQDPDGGAANECDPRTQDCPEGQKCTAWSNDGGTFWNANRCVEVSGEGVDGDPCMIEGGGVSGIDDCAKGFICMNTDEEGIGTCIKFCQGSDEDCAPGNVCAVYNDGVLPICLVGCDPLLQECPPGQACIDTPNQSFICFTDASGEAGADGDPCPPADGENSCDPGMWCGPGSNGCMDVNCCTPYCDLSDPICTAPDECVTFFGEGAAPPGFENVGVCVLP